MGQQTRGLARLANAGVRSMNEIFSRTSASKAGSRPSAMQLNSLDQVCNAYRDVSAVESNNAAEAFKVLCGSVPGYTGNGVKKDTCKEGLPLPDPGGKMADGSALLTGSDLEAWRDWRRILLRSPSELQKVIVLEGELLLILTPSSNGNLGAMRDLCEF